MMIQYVPSSPVKRPKYIRLHGGYQVQALLVHTFYLMTMMMTKILKMDVRLVMIPQFKHRQTVALKEQMVGMSSIMEKLTVFLVANALPKHVPQEPQSKDAKMEHLLKQTAKLQTVRLVKIIVTDAPMLVIIPQPLQIKTSAKTADIFVRVLAKTAKPVIVVPDQKNVRQNIQVQNLARQAETVTQLPRLHNKLATPLVTNALTPVHQAGLQANVRLVRLVKK